MQGDSSYSHHRCLLATWLHMTMAAGTTSVSSTTSTCREWSMHEPSVRAALRTGVAEYEGVAHMPYQPRNSFTLAVHSKDTGDYRISVRASIPQDSTHILVWIVGPFPPSRFISYYVSKPQGEVERTHRPPGSPRSLPSPPLCPPAPPAPATAPPPGRPPARAVPRPHQQPTAAPARSRSLPPPATRTAPAGRANKESRCNPGTLLMGGSLWGLAKKRRLAYR